MQARRRKSAESLLSDWQRVLLVTNGNGIGYSGTTTIARAAAGELSHTGRAGSRLPAHADMPGMSGFLAVERVLAGFSAAHRATLLVEHVHPTSIVGRTQRARAEFMGISPHTYIRRLSRVREALDAG